MDMLERELVRTLKDVESQTAASTDLTDQVTRGLRSHRRRSALALATLAVVAVAGASTATWLFAAGDWTTNPPLAGPAARIDCSSVQALASGVSTYRTADGGRELTLVFTGQTADRAYTCPIDDRLDITLTTPRGAQASSTYATADAESIQSDTTVAVDLTWSNWCHSGPITATATFPDGTSASIALGKNSATPRCTSPGQPVSLEIARAQSTSVAAPD